MNIRNRIALYAAVIGLILGVWLESPRYYRPPVYSVPSGKVVAYLAQPDAYQVLFVGDSRTFTDIQPRTVSPLIGRPSYNLATFGLWMPVEYLEYQDVFPHVPQGTVVVWSLSHHNFAPVDVQWWIPGQYKFSLADAAEYVLDGYPVERVIREYDESPFSPVDLVVKRRKELTSSFENVVWRSNAPAAPATESTPAASGNADGINVDAARILELLKQDTSLTYVSPTVDAGIITSIETIRTDGGYDRILVDDAYYRRQQAPLWPVHSNVTECQFNPNGVYMRTFGKILDLVSKYQIRMVVNYIEDAPGSWQSDIERQCAKQFMQDKIVPMLTARGIAYMAPDLYPVIGFNDDFYFDNSHLTTNGAAIYSKLFASDLAQVLASKGW